MGGWEVRLNVGGWEVKRNATDGSKSNATGVCHMGSLVKCCGWMGSEV